MNNNRNISFENKLQSLSHDFELKPAADSWNKIEAQLEKRTKRRFLFWIIPVGVLILAGVFIFNNQNSKNYIHASASIKQETANESKYHQKKLNANIDKSSISVNDNLLSLNENSNTSTHKTITTNSLLLNGGSRNDVVIKDPSKKHKKKSLIFVNATSQEEHPTFASAENLNHENDEMIKINMLNPSLSNQINLPLIQNNFEEIKKPESTVRWSFGIGYMPMFTTRKVNYDFKNNGTSLIEDTAFKKNDQALFANNFGADAYYHFNEKFFLHSGVYAINYGEKTFYDKRIYSGVPAAPTNLTAYADYIAPGSEREIINKYSFVQVPVNVGLALRTGTKTSLNMETGFSYGYLIKVKAMQYVTIDDSLQLNALDDAQLTRMNRNHLFANAAISFDWYILKNVSWNNGFTVQYQITDMYKKDELQSQHNYGFGLRTGFIFHLK